MIQKHILLLASALVVGCASFPGPPVVSGIDARYELGRLSQTQVRGLPSGGVEIYRKLPNFLGSACQWFPSDSAYSQFLHQRCGAVPATLMSYARFSMEFDAAQLGFPVFREGETLVFKDLPDCSDQLFGLFANETQRQ